MKHNEYIVSFRLDPETKESLQKLAKLERRSLAQYCRIILEDHVTEKGKES